MKSKKGQLGNLVSIVSIVAFVGILIAVGFLVLQEFYQQDSLVDNSVTATDNNAYINSTGYTLSGATSSGFNAVSITSIVNATNGANILSGNYSVSSAGVLTNATTTTWANVNVTYTYNQGEEAYESVNDTIDAMTTVPDLLGLIILVAIVGLILAILLGSFPNFKGGA